MDRFRSLQMFLEVARSKSFAAAARHLGLSKATVTKDVARFERTLGARLFNRTTKQVMLTDAGAKILLAAQDVLDSYDSLEMEARDSTSNARGVLRIGAPPAFASLQLAPLIVSFSEAHRDIQIVVTLDDGTSSLVVQGLDLSIRIAFGANDSSNVVVPLMRAPQVLVASPDYLRRHGTPRHPRDLAKHNCLINSIKYPTGRWQFTGPEGDVSARVRGSFYSGFGDPLQAAALMGLGVSLHPNFMVNELIGQGRLVALLPQYVPRELDIFAIYSSRENLPVRVRRFLDHLKAWAAAPPAWAVRPEGGPLPRKASGRSAKSVRGGAKSA